MDDCTQTVRRLIAASARRGTPTGAAFVKALASDYGRSTLGAARTVNSVAALWLSCPFCRASARLFL